MSRLMSFFSLLAILSAFILSSCGHDHGGGETTAVLKVEEVSVSGTVLADGSPPSNTVFSVEIVSLSSDGKSIDRQTTQTALSQQNLSVNGSFSAKVKAVVGGKIIVKASAPGYTEPIKTLNYKGGNTISITLDAQSVQVQTVSVQDGLVINSSGRRYVRIAFTKDGNGTKPVLGIQAVNANSKLIDLAIPVDALQSDTITVSYRAYNPSNPDDYQNFPGDEREDGNRLVSIGFDYLKIEDENGNNPFVQGLRAQLVNGEYYRILRSVDCAQINSIRSSVGSLDEDPNKAGVQLTFYAFDSDRGVWVEAGQGTFVDNNTIDFMNSEWDTIVQNGCDPNQTSNDPNDGIASCSEYGIFTNEDDICPDNLSEAFVVVSVTNPALEWKNLDYVIPAGSTVSCRIRVVDENNQPVAGAWVYASASCMAYINGMTDTNGEVVLETIGYNDPCTATVETWRFGYIASGTANFDSGDQCQLTLQIQDPFDCYVEGRVVDDSNQPVDGITVYTFDYVGEIPRVGVGVTDSQGRFSIKTACNQDMVVSVKYILRGYNVNGTVDQDTFHYEISDNGTTVDVGTIQIVNEPPYGYINSATDPQLGSPMSLAVCAWDYENDYPISYTVSVNGSQLDQGQITQTSLCAGASYTPSTPGQYAFTAQFADSDGRASTSNTDLVFYIENNHYIRTEIYATGYRDDYGNNQAMAYVYISIYAFDSDNTHTLSQSASYTCYDQNGTQVASGTLIDNGWNYILCSDIWCDGTIPGNTSYCDIDITITDGTATINHTKRVNLIEAPYPPPTELIIGSN